MSDVTQLPELTPEEANTLFSVPYNLVSGSPLAEFTNDDRRESIPVVNEQGNIVAIADLAGDSYEFHLPLEYVIAARLGEVYFEFSLNATFHDSRSTKETREADTRAILILSTV